MLILKNSVTLSQPFWTFFSTFFFASSPWISVKGSLISRMGWNFDDYPGLQQKITHPKHLSCQCNKKCAIKPIFQLKKKIRLRKLTLKVRIWHFLTRPKCFAKHPKAPIIGENCWSCKTIWRYGLPNMSLSTFITLLSRPLCKNPSIPAFV